MISSFHLRKVKDGYEFGGNIGGVFGKSPEEAKHNFWKVMYPGVYEFIDKTFSKENKMSNQERATEFEYLEYFYATADFGPADSEVRDYIQECFIKDTGKLPPEGYYYGNENE